MTKTGTRRSLPPGGSTDVNGGWVEEGAVGVGSQSLGVGPPGWSTRRNSAEPRPTQPPLTFAAER